MIGRHGPLGVAAACLVTTVVAAQVYRGGTDTVLLSVTVTGASQALVRGLDRTDFQVFEDNIPQELSNFSREQQPVSLCMLIDSSTSMEDRLSVAQEAAIGFARRLGSNDVAQIVDFNNDIQIRQTFTSDAAALEKAIRSIRAGGSTSLYNALYSQITDMRRVRARSQDEIRRQAIVVLSDGEDTTSLVNYEDVLDIAKRSEVSVYAISLRPKEAVQRRPGFNEADFVLRTLSQVTGGRIFFVTNITQLPDIYRQIADELANQYVMSYQSKNQKRDGAWRTVAVRVAQGGSTARTKAGYFGPTAGR
jgi:Ca-activated chloride channel family protein